MSVKKKVLDRGQTAIKCEQAYRVKGELGFYEFEVYKGLESGWRMFDPQVGKSCYKTENYRAMVFYRGATQQPYRKVSEAYNHRVRQADKALLYRSIQKEVSQEARAIKKSIEAQSAAILSSHGVNEEGQVKLENYNWQDQQKDDLQKPYNEMYEQAPDHIKPHLNLDAGSYEEQASTIAITVDDICVKEQKAKRKKLPCSENKISEPVKARRSGGKKVYKKRKFAYSTVVHLEAKEGQYSLCGQGLLSMIRIITAFLLNNKGLQRNWLFFVDGQRTLQDCLLNRFSWHEPKLLLDWYHLQKKIHSQLFKALYTTDERDKILTTLRVYAWYGLVDPAINFIDRIKIENIKNQEELRILKGYLQRNQAIIPNYEMRQRLGLRNSSNRGEKQNDLLIAQRQKHNGMGWSKDGSCQLALLTSIQRNGEREFWFKNQQVQFNFAKTA